MVQRSPSPKRRKMPVCEEFNWKTECCESGHIHVTIMKPGAEPFEASFIPEDGYELAHDILKAYDQANGI